MKINYDVLRRLNNDSITTNGEQMNCYWLVQQGVEKIIYDEHISDIHKQMLIDLGVVEDSEDEQRKNIVGPFKFSEDGSTNS